MKFNKRSLFICFLFFVSGVGTRIISQTLTPPRFYTGVELYNKSFFLKEDGYLGFFVGTEIFSVSLVAPEIEVGYFSGSIKYEEPDIEGVTSGYYNGRRVLPKSYTVGFYNSWTFGITPKLAFGDEDFRFLILPKYSIASTSVRASYHLIDDTRAYYNKVEWDEKRDKQSYFTFGIGAEGRFFDSDKLSFALTLHYSTWNIQELFEEINVKGLRGKEGKGAIGFGLRLYFNPFLKE